MNQTLPAPDPLESPLPGEAETTRRVIDKLKAMMTSQHAAADRPMRRDVHQKMHGLMQAEFTVEADLPAEWRVGVFAEPRRYEAWVRFSNGINAVNPDAVPDVRGMAIKLMGVDGAQLLGGDARTQDFTLMSADHFPVGDMVAMEGLVDALLGSLGRKLIYFPTHPRTLWQLISTSRVFANPLQIRYFSAAAYRFGTSGNRAVKYCATPRFFNRVALPPDLGRNFLRDAAREQLAREPALFEFCAQERREGWSVEDARASWPEHESPFVKLATLRIAPQDFDNTARDALGERLSFHPWHGIIEHRPLGSLNRARRVIYETLSAYRHRVNRAPMHEPTSWEDS